MFGAKKKVASVPSPQTADPIKPPIWNYFSSNETDKSKALCKLCGGSYSLGSDKPKFQTTGNIKNHLKSKHHKEYENFLKVLEDSRDRKDKRNRESDCNIGKIGHLFTFMQIKHGAKKCVI